MSSEPNQPTTRRGFLSSMGALFFALVAFLGPLIAGAAFFFTPLKRRKAGGGEKPGEWTRITTLDMLKSQEVPLVFPVVRERRDAWTNYGMQRDGLVFVKLEGDGKVTAWNAACPHLDCPVKFVKEEDGFACACHGAEFDAKGETRNNVAPRGLDTLEAEIRNKNEVWVRFVKFQNSVAKKIPRT